MSKTLLYSDWGIFSIAGVQKFPQISVFAMGYHKKFWCSLSVYAKGFCESFCYLRFLLVQIFEIWQTWYHKPFENQIAKLLKWQKKLEYHNFSMYNFFKKKNSFVEELMVVETFYFRR